MKKMLLVYKFQTFNYNFILFIIINCINRYIKPITTVRNQLLDLFAAKPFFGRLVYQILQTASIGEFLLNNKLSSSSIIIRVNIEADDFNHMLAFHMIQLLNFCLIVIHILAFRNINNLC